MYALFLSLVLCISTHVFADRTSDVQAASQSGFLDRWRDFRGDEKQFPVWTPNCPESVLKTRFSQIASDRCHVYFINPEECIKNGAIGLYKKVYQTPENWTCWGSRYPYPGAFSYNLATSSYNASFITLHGKRFLAMEAPTRENQDAFIDLVSTYHVTDLVRLTPAVSNGKENSFPYWEGHINMHPKTGRPTIELGGREINYFFTDRWEDHKGFPPDRMIAMVKSVMAQEVPEQMIAVHCRAGVGRTGTFLAAYILIHDIDEQMSQGKSIDNLQVSIDKIVWELSLQRPFLVTHFSQYMSLYRLVDTYIESLKS